MDAAPAVFAPTIDSAIRTGLAQNELDGGATLGIDLTGYVIGPSVHVQSLAAGIPSYQLIELLVDKTPRAMVLLDETSSGYAFGAITPLSGTPAFMSSAGRSAALTAQGMSGAGDLVWAPVGNSTPFGPFIRGVDAKTGQPAFFTMRGRMDSVQISPRSSAP